METIEEHIASWTDEECSTRFEMMKIKDGYVSYIFDPTINKIYFKYTIKELRKRKLKEIYGTKS